MALIPHVFVIDEQYPSSRDFAHLIDKGDTRHEHWYWDDEFHVGPFARTPVFRWSPTGQGRRGIYVVARLLWVEANPGERKRLELRSMCGVYCCVNPAHWENMSRERVWTLPGESAAELVRCTYLADVLDPIDKTVEGYEQRTTVHIRVKGSMFAACTSRLMRHGRRRNNKTEVLVEREPITCEKCLAEWRKLGRLLEEVPGG